MFTTLLLLLLQIAAPGQQAPATNPADLCTIQGVVIKVGTGEPLHKADVDAEPMGNTNRNRIDEPQGGSAETDMMGRFEIRDLAPGKYRLWVERNGYVWQSYGQLATDKGGPTTITLSPGQKASDITFQMVPAAAIAGHVYDEDGDPVMYAQVTAMRYAYVNGQRQLEPRGQGQTNDLGEFRIFSLPPGQYFVRAAVRSTRPANSKVRQGYIPIFYPGVLDASHATPITLHGGDDFSGADISLQPVHTFSIRGSVINSGCGGDTDRAFVMLQEQSNTMTPGWMSSAPHALNAQGTFEIPNVIPGSYNLFAVFNAEGKQCFGRQSLDVTDADVEGVSLVITPGVDIKGQVRVDGQSDSNIGSLQVFLAPKSSTMSFGGSRSDGTKSDGSFVLKNASPGEYEIRIGNLPDNAYIKSAAVDGVDVLANGFTVDGKQTPGSLDILLSANGGSIDGTVSKDQQPFQGATVAVVPDPPYRGQIRLYKSATTDPNGRFFVQGLAPGDYKVFAWEKVDLNAYTSAEFLQPYENQGTAVHVTEGSRNSVQLDLIPAKDTSQ